MPYIAKMIRQKRPSNVETDAEPNPFGRRHPILAKTEEASEKLQKLNKSVELNRKVLLTKTESWLARHGKTKYIKFHKEKKSDLRQCFLSIDINGSKSIELDEIIEAMLTLGIADSKIQAKQMFREVDTDKSGHIEFDEFLQLLRTTNPKVKGLTELFDNVIEKKLGFDMDLLPFQLVVSNYRRRMIMNAIMEPGNPKEELILKSTSQVFSRKFKKIKMNIQKNYKARNSLKHIISIPKQ